MIRVKKTHNVKKSLIEKVYMAKKFTKYMWVWVSPWVFFLNMKKYINKLSI